MEKEYGVKYVISFLHSFIWRISWVWMRRQRTSADAFGRDYRREAFGCCPGNLPMV